MTTTVTKPIILDETGQEIKAAILQLGGDCVHYAEDTGKTAEQKAQARTNIGASDFSGAYDDLTGKPELATVATSGAYSDLTGKPTIPSVINNVTSTSAANALSANMGKQLQDQISNLQNIGRFLAIWDCTTGLPLTDPTVLPYQYRTGDYYRVGAVSEPSGGTNYKPNGPSYNHVASTTAETETVEVGAVYYFDGSIWRMQASGGGGTVQDVQIDSVSIIDAGSGIANIPKASDSAFGVIKTWQGTQAQYESIATKDADCFYFITE